MLREGGAGGIGAAEPQQGQASRYEGWRTYTRFARTTGLKPQAFRLSPVREAPLPLTPYPLPLTPYSLLLNS